MKRLIVLTAFIFLFSCSKATSKKDVWIQENDIKSSCSISEALKHGLAVIFNTRVRNNDLFGDPYLGWPLANREQILEELRKNSSAVVEIPDLSLSKVAINPVDEEEVVEGYTKMSADVGANYLLLFHAAGGVETEQNFFQILYLTIIGAFIFPGNEGEGQASLQAFLYKAGNSRPCFTLETAGTSSQYRPYVFFSSKELYQDARDNAFDELVPLLRAELQK